MKVLYVFHYALIVGINVLPFIPMSIKGIAGLIFIAVSCILINRKHAMITATLLIVMGYINFFLGINVDYHEGMVTMLMGSAAYYLMAFFFGSFTEGLSYKNKALSEEIERRKLVEQELNEKLTLLQSLMDTLPSPIFFKDLNLKFIGCNRAYEQVIGIKDYELIGKTVFDITKIEHALSHHNMDEELLKQLGTKTYEHAVEYADGRVRDIIFSKAIMKDNRGAPMGIVGVMTDITDKNVAKELHQTIVEKKQIIDEILENDKMKTEFFSNISHELRTPLNVILGSVQLMELYLKNNQFTESEEKFTRNIATMKQNCYRLLRIVNNLIDISKIDAKAFEIHLNSVDLVKVVKEITLSVSDYIENKGIQLVFATDIENKTMACDDEKIERILLNLLSNSIKFTPAGGRISVNIHDREDGICIKVADNGIGIPEDKQDQIFQRFCQINKMFTRLHEGSGIGLNLVKSLVEMHGGTIEFVSKEGEGTSFIIYLPENKVEVEQKCASTLVRQAHIERIHVEFSDIYSIVS